MSAPGAPEPSGHEKPFYSVAQEEFYAGGPEHPWLGVRYATTRRLLERFPPRDGARTRVLDIGCGPGNCMRALPAGLECYGTDLKASPLKIARSASGARVFASQIGELPVRTESMDYSILLDVAEHVEDDVGLFREVRRVLAPGGYAIVMVPAHMALWGSHDEEVGHFRRYVRRELAEKLARAEFEVLETRYMMPFTFFALYAMRRLKRARKQQTDDFFALPGWVDALARAYLAAETAVSRAIPFPWGSVLYSVARKPA